MNHMVHGCPERSAFGEIKEDDLMFLGEYQTRFSGKGRIILPRKIRLELKAREVILSRGFEGCIWGFDLNDFEKEAKQQLEISATGKRARFLRRHIFASAMPAELDSQGRFIIPSALLTYAKIKTGVVVIGAGDHFEIWNAGFWKKHLATIEREYGRRS